jgi:hypothetical protein
MSFESSTEYPVQEFQEEIPISIHPLLKKKMFKLYTEQEFSTR